MKYLGNYAEDATVTCKFNTVDSTGAPITLGGTPAVSVYKAGSTTESTAGVTLTADYDSRTGLHNVTIDTSADAFYATDADYDIVITTGTVDGVSVVGTVVGSFSIEKRFAIDVPANFTLLDIDGSGYVSADTVEIGGAEVNGSTPDVNVVSISGDTAAADNLEAAFDGTGYNVGNGSIVAASVTGTVGSVTGNVGGNVAGSVASVAGNIGGSVASISGVTFPANFSSLAITGGGAVTVGTLPSIPTGWITAAGIASEAITSAKFAENAITEGAIDTAALTTAKFDTEFLTANLIADDAITSAKIATDAKQAIATTLLDLTAGVETNLTPRQAFRLWTSALVGKSSNDGKTFRDYNDSKARITATVDADGNRTAVTTDAT